MRKSFIKKQSKNIIRVLTLTKWLIYNRDTKNSRRRQRAETQAQPGGKAGQIKKMEDDKMYFKNSTEAIEAGYLYSVDVDRVAKTSSGMEHEGDPDYDYFKSLEEAKADYADKIEHWKIQPDRPRIVSLSVYEPEYDSWSGLEREIVK